MNPNDIAPTIAAITFFVSMVLIFRGAIGKAIARRIEGKAVADSALYERIEELEHRLAEVEQDRLRVAELEERLDFTERILAKSPERVGGKTP
jgi:predicted dinucleotide-utilizing enzyme